MEGILSNMIILFSNFKPMFIVFINQKKCFFFLFLKKSNPIINNEISREECCPNKINSMHVFNMSTADVTVLYLRFFFINTYV